MNEGIIELVDTIAANESLVNLDLGGNGLT